MTLKELERKINRIRPHSLVLLCRTMEGEEKEMSVAEAIETGSEFICVVSGNDLNEFDEWLAHEMRMIRGQGNG